jgi:formate dehydrogenase assembly factor FdhD
MSGEAASELRRAFSYDGERFVETQETVIREVPLAVYVNDRPWITIACLGRHVDELAVGFLHSEGLLRRREDLAGLEVSSDGHQVRVRTAAPEAAPAPTGRVLTSSGARLAGTGGQGGKG